MKEIKKYDIKTNYDIKVYMGNYDKKDFYSRMGEFFAERNYRKKLPYLINDIDKMWYLVYEKDVLVGFFGVKICSDNTLVSDIYIDEKYDKISIFKYMAEYLTKLFQEERLKVLTKYSYEKSIWLNLGFKIVGTRGNYAILIREGIK